MIRVDLNGNSYLCAEPLDWRYVNLVSDVLRTEGIPVREDNPVISRLRYGWEKGIGWERMDRKTGSGVGGLRDARVETRWPIAELALANETQTHAGPADHAKVYENFSGDFFCAFEGDYQSGQKNIAGVGKWSPDTWGSAFARPQFASVTTGTTNSAATFTVSHSVQATAGAGLVVANLSVRNNAAPANPTGVTYNGVAMTQGIGATSTDMSSSIWYLVAPATGANDCVATFASTMDRIMMAVTDYYYVNQTTPTGGTGSDTGSGTSCTFNLTTITEDLCIDNLAQRGNSGVTPGAGQTERFDFRNGGP